jgi:uncharacterized protein
MSDEEQNIAKDGSMGNDTALSDFEWDETKRRSNFEKHGIDFEEAVIALAGQRLEYASPRYGEDRVVAVCLSEDRLIAVVYTMRGRVCRIISARAARAYERKEYHTRYAG